MKNRYIKRSHFSEAKFRQILQLFRADLQANQIAKIARVSRPSVNALLYKIRARISMLIELNPAFPPGGCVEIDESYFGGRRIRGKRGRGASGKTVAFGIKKRGANVYTRIVNNCSASELLPIIKDLVSTDSVIFSDEWKAYDRLAQEGYHKHKRVRHGQDLFVDGDAHVNGIENFWGLAKTRMTKFRGIRKDMLYLHLKECEWRFNNRHKDQYLLLLKEFRKNPL